MTQELKGTTSYFGVFLADVLRLLTLKNMGKAMHMSSYKQFSSFYVYVLYMHRRKNGTFEKVLIKKRLVNFPVECDLASSSLCIS